MTVTQHENDPAVCPPYYTGLGGLEVIDVIDRFDLTYYEARIIEHVIRARRKGGLTDLRRAKYFIDRLISNVEAEKERAARHEKLQPHPVEVTRQLPEAHRGE
jgi:hypothetical protein